MYVKRILCLANSKKTSGRCVAGKEVDGQSFGEWIRPIGHSPTHEISYEDRRYSSGGATEVLDIVEIPLLRPVPSQHQSENHLIAASRSWKRIGRADWRQVQEAVDAVEGSLWINEASTQHGRNDKVAEGSLGQLRDSLKLVKVAALNITVAFESGFQGRPGKTKVRGSFHLNRIPYTLAITDPVIEAEFRAKGDGTYELGPATLCISLAEPWNGYAFKVVATVLLKSRV